MCYAQNLIDEAKVMADSTKLHNVKDVRYNQNLTDMVKVMANGTKLV